MIPCPHPNVCGVYTHFPDSASAKECSRKKPAARSRAAFPSPTSASTPSDTPVLASAIHPEELKLAIERAEWYVANGLQENRHHDVAEDLILNHGLKYSEDEDLDDADETVRRLARALEEVGPGDDDAERLSEHLTQEGWSWDDDTVSSEPHEFSVEVNQIAARQTNLMSRATELHDFGIRKPGLDDDQSLMALYHAVQIEYPVRSAQPLWDAGFRKTHTAG